VYNPRCYLGSATDPIIGPRPDRPIEAPEFFSTVSAKAGGIGGVILSRAKERLFESVTCTAVFAIVFGLVVSCGGGAPSLLNSIKGTASKSPVARILSHLSPTSAALPHTSTQPPLIAMAFQSSQQASQIQQSFQGLSCDAFTPGTEVNWSGSTTGFIPIQVLGDPWITGSPNSNAPGGFNFSSVCYGVFAQLGGGTSLLPLVGPGGAPGVGGGTLASPGTAIYADGTLSTLVVTGISLAGEQIRCSDLTDTALVHDSDLVQPYFVIDTNSVVLAVGSTQLPLTCQLNIARGDQAGSISVQWAKI